MNVALALFRYFPHGGMQRDLRATALRCLDAGHAVHIYCHTFEGPSIDGATIEVLPASGIANHVRARRFATSLRQRLQQTAADVVVGFDKLPGLDLYIAADPCFVARTQDRGWLYRMTARYRTFRGLEGAVFSEASHARILLLDESQRASYREHWHTGTERFTLLPPGIARDRCRGDDATAQRSSTRSAFGIGESDHLLLLLAANFELKGLDRAITALAQLPRATRDRSHLLAVGQAADPRLRRLANELGIGERVTMLPGRDDVPALLQAADLLVHPARHDTTGTVLLEALVAGLPVACTATCGYARHIEAADCGRVLPEPFGQAEFTQAIAELLAADSAPLRERALAYAGGHDLHGMHDQILAAIEAAFAAKATALVRRPRAPTAPDTN